MPIVMQEQRMRHLLPLMLAWSVDVVVLLNRTAVKCEGKTVAGCVFQINLLGVSFNTKVND